MLSLAWLTVLLLFVNLPALQAVSGPHVADVNILLPPLMTYPVEYRLQGSDGCFSWSWDHHDILSVQPEYNASSRCSTSARLRSIAPYGGRKETAVYAADLHSGTVIRCKVFIDNISRIQIFHNSIKLDLDGLATLRVRAFDSEENVFSSLVGLQFMWKLIPEADRVQHHLTHVALKDSPLSDCGGFCGDLDIQIKLEDSGVFSDLFVVKGTGIGHEIVSVHLLEPQFEYMVDEIVLTVAEAMSLEPPSPVFVLIGSYFHYSLKVVRQNTPQAIDLPSPYHRWHVSNSSVAQVDSMMGLTHSLNLGVTTITVEDTRVSGHAQMSSLHVVLPDAMYLYIVPLSISGDPMEGITAIPTAHWHVVVGRQYVIHMKVFSRGPYAHEIYITEGDDIKLCYNQSLYWDILLVQNSIAVKHGWRNSRILKATSQGMGRLTASLTHHTEHPAATEVLKVVQEVMVCDQVKFRLGERTNFSHSIYLPWAPGVYQEVELRAMGGCAKTSSDYKWYSSDAATVSVSPSGVIQAKKPGQASVKVASIFDLTNYDEVIIEVSVPSSMVMMQNFPVETVVGTNLQAAVTLKTFHGASFYRCDAFCSSIRWKTGSESFKIVNTTGDALALDKLLNIKDFDSLYGPPCSWTYIYASTAGRTMLHSTLSKLWQTSDHPLDGPIVLKASSHIAAYQPLIVYQAGDGNKFGGYWVDLANAEAGNQLENLDELYLVPGTGLDVMLLGGPERWNEGTEFIESIEIFDEEYNPLKDEVIVHQASTSSDGVYGVLCHALGNYKLVFSRSNLVGDDHPVPAIEKSELSLTCSFPASITLIANEPVNALDLVWSATQADRNPGRIRVIPITVANGCTIRVAAVGIHNSGKAFANSSSLCLKWELSSCDGLAYWTNDNGLERSSASWGRFLVLQNVSGLCIVRATVIGFSDTMTGRLYEKASLMLEDQNNVLTDAIRLQLVSSLRVIPEYILLFFSLDAKVNLSITGGTCFMDAVVNDTRVIEVIQPPPSFQCLQVMLGPVGLGSARVTIHDMGLSPPLAASAVVQVADVDWIKIISQDDISLMEGSAKVVDILAGIRDGSTFDASQYVYMNIHVHIEDPILELVNKDDISDPGSGNIDGPKFIIQAKQLGITTLYVSARQCSGHEISSQPIKVEVYAPPRIHPDDLFLVPGASYVLTVEGGPTVGAYVEYASMDDGTATVNRTSGRLVALSPGKTTVLATMYGAGDSVICQAKGKVEVGIPSSMILNLQSQQIGVGREMPVFPSLPEGNLFSFYELCNNYKWTVEDEQVLSFQVAKCSYGEKYDVLLSGLRGIMSSSYSDNKELNPINVLHGRSAGKTNVAVSFSCKFSSGAFSQSRSYNASALVWVVSDPPLALGKSMTWVLPPFYTTSNLLPGSTESYSHRDSHSRKGPIIYSLLKTCGGKNEEMQQKAISLDGDRIKTMESNDIDCIQAKDRSTGIVEIASCVRVAEVSQIRLGAKKFPFHVAELAVGAELELVVSYCDDLGNPFFEAYDVVEVNAETNYPDIVLINGTPDNNGNIHLKAVSHGRALVRISIGNNARKSDYIMISVGAHLHPQNPVLHVGRYLNFSVEGLSDLVSGQWLSSNESVISVDMLSGEAHAVGEGTSQVIFEGLGLKLQTTITVLMEDQVSVDAPTETLTNVPFPSRGYNFSVSFSQMFGALGKSKEVLYDCSVDPPFVGYARPWRDINSGNSYCLFFPYSPEHLVHSIPKTKAMRPDVSVSISASLREAEYVMGSATALFVGGFSILEMDKGLMQLNLTPESNKSIINIVGNTDVEVHQQGRDLIQVSPIYKEDFGIGGRVGYEVKVLKTERIKETVTITLPATGQRAEIIVSYEPGESEASPTRSFALWASIFGFFTISILTLAIFMWFLDKPARPSVPATPNIAAPTTPDRSSPASYNMQQSPRTPQPFVDYVRRTIDETPYYKREGRRRFNPQNTF
ncbi:PREDICTED: nuclear pore complex protein GP210 [Nelumbo nucifera]|uniref:Nuclear pore complex protein GP210 n=1 Tax=Nelumbo nucifera TaxID=4432 RepID=A0A1U7ZBS3_NELNU|nr:PREDICTED: nuclear pore complex protein GP210 [Nelumbo nucifera]XP_010248632.1 PREDICTED: nuclear pore complex protein GP210 [Nelumbo nucifera]